MSAAVVTTDEHAVHVLLTKELDPDLEYRFTHMLMTWATYLQFNSQTQRLTGYGIARGSWENFRFWLAVSMLPDDNHASDFD